MKHRKYDTIYSYVDLLFCVLMGILLMFIFTFPFVNPQVQKKNGVELKGDFVITAEWDKGDDVDLWVQDPKGGIVYFQQREVGLMHLDTDNRGYLTNSIQMADGTVYRSFVFNEMVTLRGVIPGEYTVNVHLFDAKDKSANYDKQVRVSVQKLKPSASLVYNEVIILEHRGVEKTAIRFTLDAGGNVVQMDRAYKRLLR